MTDEELAVWAAEARAKGTKKSGVRGVYWDKYRLWWTVTLQHEGVRKKLGNFKDLNNAVKARKQAELDLTK